MCNICDSIITLELKCLYSGAVLKLLVYSIRTRFWIIMKSEPPSVCHSYKTNHGIAYMFLSFRYLPNETPLNTR